MTTPERETAHVSVSDLGVDGVGRDASGTVRVENGVPPEQGTAVVRHRGQHQMLLRLVEPTPPSPIRATPPCPRWQPDSPCRIMHLKRPAQLAFKTATVAKAFAAADVPVKVQPTVAPGSDLGWRQRTIYVVASGPDGPQLGAYRRRSHHVQPMLDCLLPCDAIGEVARELQRALSMHHVAVFDPELVLCQDGSCGTPTDALQVAPEHRAGATQPSGLRYAVLRASERGQVQVVLLTGTGDLAQADAVARTLVAKCSHQVSVHLGVAGAGDRVFSDIPPRTLVGSAALAMSSGGFRFDVAPLAFFQANPVAAGALHDAVVDRARGPRVADVYCGVGTIALRLAAAGHCVTAIEHVAEAVSTARAAAARASLDVEFIQGDASELQGTDYTTVVVNPPRKGCDAAALGALRASEAPRIIYVSCNPKALARDCARLAEDYSVTEATPFDLFPHSEHIEVVVVLDRL